MKMNRRVSSSPPRPLHSSCLWVPVMFEFLLSLLSMMDQDEEVEAKNPFLSKLLRVVVFYHNSNPKTETLSVPVTSHDSHDRSTDHNGNRSQMAPPLFSEPLKS